MHSNQTMPHGSTGLPAGEHGRRRPALQPVPLMRSVPVVEPQVVFASRAPVARRACSRSGGTRRATVRSRLCLAAVRRTRSSTHGAVWWADARCPGRDTRSGSAHRTPARRRSRRHGPDGPRGDRPAPRASAGTRWPCPGSRAARAWRSLSSTVKKCTNSNGENCTSSNGENCTTSVRAV